MRHNVKHRKSNFPEYRVWADMRQRCNNPNNPAYFRYGGRGISVCERWEESFENFWEDMGPRPEGNFSIERKDNNGNYEPGNCCWVPMREQAANTRKNRYIDGRVQSHVAQEMGVTLTCIRRRLKHNQPITMQKHALARGEHCHMAKLTNQQVREIRALWISRKGEKGLGRKLAKEYGVSAPIICWVVNRKTYKYA
jgi:hypothetical protein